MISENRIHLCMSLFSSSECSISTGIDDGENISQKSRSGTKGRKPVVRRRPWKERLAKEKAVIETGKNMLISYCFLEFSMIRSEDHSFSHSHG